MNYDAVILTAKTTERAIEISLDDYFNFTKENITVRVLGTTNIKKEKVLSRSFNAG